jgi:hypothetical protein
MADRYWVGGTGTWNTSSTTNWSASSGGATGASVPTSVDDVIFDVNSNVGTGTFTVTIPSTTTVTCRNFTTGAGLGALDAVMTLAFAASTSQLNVAGSIATPATNFIKTGTGALVFTATTTGQTVSFQGTLAGWNSISFNGIGGGWTLQTAISSSSWTLTAGSLDTNGQTLTQSGSTGSFNISGTGVRSLALGASTIILQSITSGWNAAPTTNLTFSAGTSTLQISPGSWSSPNFDGGSLTYNNLTLTYPGSGANDLPGLAMTGNNTFNNFTVTVAISNGLYALSLAGNLTVTGTWTTNTNIIRRFYMYSSVTGTARTVSVAAVSGLANVDFEDITVTGAVAPVSGTALGNVGGNTGITFDAPKTVYWNLAGTQPWTATGWALLSGGSPALANFPLAQDTAVIDNASAGTSLVFGSNSDYFLGSFDASARTTSFTLGTSNNAALSITGNWTNGTGLIYSGGVTVTLDFKGRNTTKTLTTAGVAMTCDIQVSGLAGLQLAGPMTLTGGLLRLTQGSFVSNNNAMSMTSFSSSATTVRTLDLGSSVVDLTSTGTVWTCSTSTNLTLNAANATIRLTSNLTAQRNVDFGNTALAYGTIEIGGSATSITLFDTGSSAAITIGNITSTKTVAHTILVGGLGAQTWQAFGVTGTAGAVVTMASDSPGSQETVTWAGGRLNLDYMNITDIGFTYTLGAANPYLVYAGANSVNGGNTAGIVFINGAAQTAYRLTTGTSWTVPVDWNSSNNIIHMIGAGGGGANAAVSGNNRAAGGAGGGGGYRVLSNQTLTPSSSIPYTIGTSFANASGGNTTFNTTNIAGGGGVGTATTTPSSSGGAGGTGTFAGGAGGAGAFGTAALTGYGTGGGGGAGGPLGVGGAGGAGASGTTSITGGGGGGNGGGSAGGAGVPNAVVGGSGGNNASGTGGGVGAGTPGTLGGGGAGGAGVGNSGSGGSGLDILDTIGGSGGRGGKAGSLSSTTNTGLYGGGGMGGTVTIAGSSTGPGAGSQGVIFIVYTFGAAPASTPVILSGVTIEGGVTIV